MRPFHIFVTWERENEASFGRGEMISETNQAVRLAFAHKGQSQSKRCYAIAFLPGHHFMLAIRSDVFPPIKQK